VSLFGHCLTLFISDVSSALCDADAYEQHDQVLEALRHRVRFRLEHEQTMLIRQIENLATRDSGPAQGARRNGQEYG
jgi:hypothetical protein